MAIVIRSRLLAKVGRQVAGTQRREAGVTDKMTISMATSIAKMTFMSFTPISLLERSKEVIRVGQDSIRRAKVISITQKGLSKGHSNKHDRDHSTIQDHHRAMTKRIHLEVPRSTASTRERIAEGIELQITKINGALERQRRMKDAASSTRSGSGGRLKGQMNISQTGTNLSRTGIRLRQIQRGVRPVRLSMANMSLIKTLRSIRVTEHIQTPMLSQHGRLL